MNKSKFYKILKLSVLVIVIGVVTGCGKKAPEPTPHHDSGSVVLICTELYEECMANNDTQGAKDALETMEYLRAFCCDVVYYDDVKNKDYNNIQYDTGKLQLAVAAYNEYNDESATDVEVDWICQFNSCTQEQHDAIDAYVEWFHNAQNGHYEGTIEAYEDDFGRYYNEMLNKYDIDITKAPAYDDLTPEQFQEAHKYAKDPSYKVDTSLWN